MKSETAQTEPITGAEKKTAEKPTEKSASKWRDPEWVHRVIELAKVYPEWGCDRIAYFFDLKGKPISAPTVQRILNSQGLGTASARLLRAEAKSQNQ